MCFLQLEKRVVKVWEFDNTTPIYPNIKQSKVLCLQLQDEGFPIDFLILENPQEFTGEEFRDSEGFPISWDFGLPNVLLECLEQIGARYLDQDLVRVPEIIL
jgi:hypothetical protein